ncbi:MAG: formyltetrahydrofolate deformylase [Bacteroidota bacterium]|jgi:formyltetrahydrofolate deformylase
MNNNAIFLIECPDQKGIVSAISDFIFRHGGNITEVDQYIDRESKQFFMRLVWDMDTFNLNETEVAPTFAKEIAQKYAIKWQLYFTKKPLRMGLFVSKLSHCLFDILGRHQSGDWEVEIPVIVSNHESLQSIAQAFNIPFVYLPINKNNKKEQEAKQLQLMRDYNIDFIVLARYMQILSEEFIAQYPNKIINIHHSFLPAFVGAKPYHAAYQRGVKIIGATSHYVTNDLDAGPIIEQDVAPVKHNNTIGDLIQIGKDIEKVVLAKAIQLHIQHKLLVVNNKTIVFN